MARKTRYLCLIALLIGLCLSAVTQTLKAQPCTIDLENANNIITPSGSNTICADALITLPALPYTGGPEQTNPVVVWAIYSAMPSDVDPGKDPALGATALLVDQDGNAIINGGTADLSYAQLLEPTETSVFIVLVPVIVNEDFTFSACSGIDLNFGYSVFEVLNPDFYPEVCNPDCVGGIYNDDCQGAYFINLSDLAPLADSTFTNVCATAIDDPELPTGCFDGDGYASTVWFTFNGNGGAYTISTLQCEGSSAEQLANTQMAIYSGECGALTTPPVACADNGNGSLYAVVENFQTIPGQAYYVLVDGFGNTEGQFCLDITETIPPPLCEANAGQTTLNVETPSVCFGTPVTATINGETAGDYSTVLIVTSTPSNEIVAVLPEGNLNLMAGSYIIYTLNYSNDDSGIILPIITIGNELVLDNLLGLIDSGMACADLSIDVIALTVLPADSPDCLPCLPNAGSLAFVGGSSATNCLGQSFSINANGSATDGYTTYYILYDNGFMVVAANNSGNFSPAGAGNYTVFALNVANADTSALLPLNSLIGLSQGEVQGLLADMGACYAESVAPLSAEVLPAETVSCYCNAAISLLSYTGINEFCLGLLSDSFMPVGANSTEGYVTALLIDYGGNGENIDLIADLGPVNFGSLGFGGGNYTVYGINYYTGLGNEDELLAQIADGITPAELMSLIGDEQLCAALTAPVSFNMLPPDSPACSCLPNPGSLSAEISSSQICVGTPILLNLSGNSTVGYTSYYILIQNTDTTDNVVGYYSSSPITINYGASYQIITLNISNDDVSNMPLITSPMEIDVFLASLAGSCYAINWIDVIAVEVLDPFAPQCFDCQASTGTVSYPSGNETLVCPNGIAPPILVSGSTADGYSTWFVITDATGNVIGHDSDPSINFAGYAQGSYTVYVVNFSNVFQPQIAAALATNPTWANFLTEVANYCLVVDTGNVVFTVVPPGTNNCLEALTVCCLIENVATDGLTYTVTFTISGGSGNYVVDGNPIEGNIFTSSSIACGTSYSFNVTDDVNSSNIIVDGVAPCQEVCFTNAGTMPDLGGGNIVICAGNVANFATSGEVLDSGDILLYILHDNSGTELGNVYAVNTIAGEFYLGYNNSIMPNTVYYLSAVAGPGDAAGGIIWDDNCTSVAAGVPVVFLNPVKIDIDGSCDWSTGEYWVTVNVSGGLPEFASDINYVISGDYGGTAVLNQNFTFSIPEAAADFYTLYATDGVCSGDTSETFICIKTPVEWLSFDGQSLPEGNKLVWKTASESESDYFEVQCSSDGQHFEPLGKIDAAGNSISIKKYEFLDRNAANGLTYYRLMQYDMNGQGNKSNIINLVRDYTRFNFIRIAPIPACDNLEITYNALSEGLVQMEVYNIAGALIDRHTLQTRNGLNTVSLSVDKFSTGIYLVSLNDGSRVITNRFVVQH